MRLITHSFWAALGLCVGRSPCLLQLAAHCIFLSSSPQQSLQQRERRPSDVGDLLRVTQLGGYRARLHTQACVAPKLSTLHITLPGISRRGEKRVPEGQTSGETGRDRKTQRPRRRKRHKSNGHTQAGSGHCNGSSPGGSHLLDLGGTLSSAGLVTMTFLGSRARCVCGGGGQGHAKNSC